MGGLVDIDEGLEKWPGGCAVPRHVHRAPYAAVVISGGYEECGSRGRFQVRCGDVLVHTAFDTHLDRFHSRGAVIVNVQIAGLAASYGRIADPDSIARLAARDFAAAAHSLREQFRPAQPAAGDWPDLLADHLICDPDTQLNEWADCHALAAETLSRGFKKVFGVTPARFRHEVRVRRALAMIKQESAPLCAIAAAAGFSDQAHMSRAIRTFTGRTPGEVKSVQDRSR